jgi:5-methyltetrahydrofolate--homocysteine methyltransferase
MLKALADRLAEAFAERLHQRVRTDLWGYAPDERWPRRPDRRAVPRHPPRAGLPGLPGPQRQARDVRRAAGGDIGMGLTESLAMTPAASVSGFYLAHPEARTSTSAASATTTPRLPSRSANPNPLSRWPTTASSWWMWVDA